MISNSSKRNEILHRGFTLVELAVVVAITGILAALILPAVQQARGTARRMTCQNNLKQFGLVLANFSEVHGTYPTAGLPESGYWRMLPFFEQSALLDQIHASQTPGGKLPKSFYISSFGCPSDAVVQANMERGDTSYYFNSGTVFRTRRDLNGFKKSSFKDTTPADITDGASQTVAMSERLVRDLLNREGDDPKRHFWWTEVRYRNPGEEHLAIEQCKNHRTTSIPQYYGVNAFQLDAPETYDHMLTPNHHGCFNGPEDFGIEAGLILIPASSNHSGGVNSLLADGSVHFISETIDEKVWSALGTRSGSESIGFTF